MEIRDVRWQDHIVADPHVCHGRACVKGTRIMVSVVLDNLARGLSLDEILASYPALTRESVQAVIAHAVIVEKCPDTNLYVGYVPGFPGAHTQAESLDELQANLKEVIEMLLEEGEPRLGAGLPAT